MKRVPSSSHLFVKRGGLLVLLKGVVLVLAVVLLLFLIQQLCN